MSGAIPGTVGTVTMPHPYPAARTTWALMLAVSVLPLASGCGPPKFYPVRGKVILKGVGALTDGEVRFRPDANHDLVATGKIKKDGTFSLTTPSQGEGVLEGTCKAVVVVAPRKGKLVIDKRFEDFDTADLQFTVTARNENFFIFDVTRPAP
jgi:hypothetical protein